MNNLEWYYWSGFIAADGSVLDKGKRKIMKVTVAKKDRSHLVKMLKYFGKKNCWGIYDRLKYSELILKNQNIIMSLQNEFDLKNKKMYFPPNIEILNKMTNAQFLAFFSGYVDGDGCIQYQSGRKDCQLSFRVHSSWNLVLIFFRNRLQSLFEINMSSPKIMNDGCCVWRICNNVHLRDLVKRLFQLSLPLLKRKWNKIDIQTLSKYEWQKTYTPRVIELRTQGYTFEKIGQQLGIKTTTAYNYFHGRNGGHNHAL